MERERGRRRGSVVETKVFASVCVCVCVRHLSAHLTPSRRPFPTTSAPPLPLPLCLHLHLSFLVFPFSFLSRFFLVVQLLKLLNAHLQPLKGVFVCVSVCVLSRYYCCLFLTVLLLLNDKRNQITSCLNCQQLLPPPCHPLPPY